MFHSFIYLSKRLFNFWVNTYFMSQFFFVATSILDIRQFIKMLWFMSLCYEILIVVLSFVFSLLLLQPFNFSPVSFACNFQDWGCVILREIDFLLKICWSIPCLHPSRKVHTWTAIAVWTLFGREKQYHCCYAEGRPFESLFRWLRATQHCGCNTDETSC